MNVFEDFFKLNPDILFCLVFKFENNFFDRFYNLRVFIKIVVKSFQLFNNTRNGIVKPNHFQRF